EAKSPKLHAVMLSLGFQGHMTPFFNLAITVASKGITVTLVQLEHIRHQLSQAHGPLVDPFAAARDSGLDIRCTTMSDGFDVDFDRQLRFVEYGEKLLDGFEEHLYEFLGELLVGFQSPDWVNFLVADTLYASATNAARKCGIPSVSFWTEPALVFHMVYHVELLRENGHYPCKDDLKEEITYLPGISSINTEDLLTALRESEASGIISRFLIKSFQDVRNADFILYNTVQELEESVLSVLNRHQPGYAIGPINFSEKALSLNIEGKSLWSVSDCTGWLDSKPPGSVLYVSFGSYINTSKELMDELAHGLLLGEVNFVWAVRTGILINGEAYSFPDGFEEKIKDKGLIIPWSNQLEVLSNPAVGGFLTHNGWNSTVESIWYGVPMICFPFTFDQPVNRKLVVDDWKIGINLSEDGSLERKRVAEKINSLFYDEEISSSLKKRMKELKGIVHDAFQVGGSSRRNFDKFLQDLKKKV
ncbi:hypothetical protein M569_01639, partial [Genlisea aurea]